MTIHKTCPYCDIVFTTQGLPNHMKFHKQPLDTAVGFVSTGVSWLIYLVVAGILFGICGHYIRQVPGGLVGGIGYAARFGYNLGWTVCQETGFCPEFDLGDPAEDAEAFINAGPKFYQCNTHKCRMERGAEEAKRERQEGKEDRFRSTNSKGRGFKRPHPEEGTADGESEL